MTEQQRQQAFIEALNQLSQQYGFTLNAAIHTEQLNNNVIQARAIVVVEPIADWKPVSQASATETTRLMPITHESTQKSKFVQQSTPMKEGV